MIQDGSLLIRDGILLEIGPTRRVENLALARHAIEINAAGRVVMPGFVDSHTHLLFPLPGAPAGDAEFQLRLLRATTVTQLKIRARGHLQGMARHGTTTVEVKTAGAADGNAELKLLRVLADLRGERVDVMPTFLFRPPPGSPPAEIGADWLQTAVRRRRLVPFADLVTDVLSPCDPASAAYWQAARSLSVPRKLHADAPGISAALHAALEHQALSVDHLEHATADDVALLGRSAIIATLLPSASYFAGRYAPARALLDAGAALAIASNFNPHETPAPSLQTAVSLACRHMGLTPAEAISAATINGAHALGCAARVGSLESGKSADLLILAISDYRDLARALGSNLVQLAIKRGQIIYEEGRVAARRPETLCPPW